MIAVIMGVSGSGKTTIGEILAKRTGAVFADADDYHPAANKAKMAAGHPLNDQDREPWLETLNQLMKGWYEAGTKGILACSALKAAYRTTLEAGMPQATIQFIVLDLPKEVLAKRLAQRKHEFMNPNLLDSQLATLEIPQDAMRITNEGTPEEVVDDILSRIRE